MQGFLEFTEEKKITVKTKMGGEIPATIKVTGKDYHIVKTDSGKQYKVDFKGNSLEEEIELSEEQLDELKKSTLASYINKAASSAKVASDKVRFHPKYQDNDDEATLDRVGKRLKGITKASAKLAKEEDAKDLPFTPDAKKTKPSTPGKYGSAYSTVRNLARKALEKQKQVKEDLDEEQIDERSEQSKQNKIKKNAMDTARGHMYRMKTGLNIDPESTGHKTNQQMNKAIGRALRNEEIEEAFDGSSVRIHSPGHSLHGMVGKVFHRHEDGRVNVQIRGRNKGDIRNVTLKPNQFKTVNEEVDLEEASRDSIEDRVARDERFADSRVKTLAQKAYKLGKFHKKTGFTGANPHKDSSPDVLAAYKKGLSEEVEMTEGYPGGLSKSDYTPGAVRHDLSNIKPKKQEPQRDRPVADIDPDWEKEQAAKRKKQGVSEGYRGNSEADKPFFDAKDHKTAAEKAHKEGDRFSYHMHMAAHHDSMAHWSSNKGRHHVADLHMSKAENHEHYAQQARKESK